MRPPTRFRFVSASLIAISYVCSADVSSSHHRLSLGSAQLMREAIRGHQKPSQVSSETIRGHQRAPLGRLPGAASERLQPALNRLIESLDVEQLLELGRPLSTPEVRVQVE